MTKKDKQESASAVTRTYPIDSICPSVRDKKVLMVGAGGIGCELLKNLVLLGVQSIHIVDLDTIDLSNLNRQFLFQRKHIKKSKAEVAKEVASQFNPDVDITAHFANIFESQFSVSWYRQFDLVFNALDNLEARRHVNRMCLAASVPLVESGTTGFLGQVQVITSDYECYECVSKPVPKTFAVCTIRSTPSQPIHCIVWAKSYLFSQLFDSDGNQDGNDEDLNDPEAEKDELEALRREANELQSLRDLRLTDEFLASVVNKVFVKDIARLAAIDHMWKTRKRPVPIAENELLQACAPVAKGDGHSFSVADVENILADDQRLWSTAENLAVLAYSVKNLQNRLKEGASSIAFDKDDEDTLNFVTAAANLRSSVFQIEQKSKFKVKEMAGNIIPAIATTNAVIAGVSVLEALKVCENRIDDCRMVMFNRSFADKAFSTLKLQPPNPNCLTSSMGRSVLRVDTQKFTLNDIVEDIVKNKFEFEDPAIITTGLVYDLDFDDNLDKKLAEVGITHNTFLTIYDENDDAEKCNIELYVEHVDNSKPELELMPTLKYRKHIPVEEAGEKRKRDGEQAESAQSKRQKQHGEDAGLISDTIEDGIIILDDDELDSEPKTKASVNDAENGDVINID